MVKKKKSEDEDEEESTESFTSKLKSIFFPEPKKKKGGGKKKMKKKEDEEESEEEEKPRKKVEKKKKEKKMKKKEDEEESEEEEESNEEEEEEESEDDNEEKSEEEEESSEEEEEEEESNEEEESEEEEEKPRKKKAPKHEDDDTESDDEDGVVIERVNPHKSLLDKINPFNVFDRKIKTYIEYYGDDLEKIHKSYRTTLKIIIPSVILSSLVGFFKIKFFLFSIPILIFVAYFYPLLYTWSKAEEHKKVVDNEAPFISLASYINSIVDKGLNITFQELSKLKEMKVARIEYTFIDKMIKFMNMSFSEAIERRAKIHTNDMLGKLYNNYLAAIELGITLRDRLRDVTRELLNDRKETYKAYVEKSSGLTEAVFSVFLLVPITLIGFSFAFKANLVDLMVPILLSPALYLAIISSQPFKEYDIKYGKRLLILLIIPVVFLIPNLPLSIKTFISMLIITAFSYSVYSQIVLANDLEKNLSILLKEVGEYMKLGYTLESSIQRVKFTSKRVNNAIMKYIRDPENINSPSRIFNITFRLMFTTSKAGTSSAALEELGNIISEIVFTKDNIIKQLRLFDALAILTPVLLWMTFGMPGKIASSTLPVDLIIGSYSVASAMLFTKISRFVAVYFPTMLSLTVITGALMFFPIQLPA